MCQTEEETKGLKSVLPLIDEIPRSKKSRFDVALFYTGGKDSTYLLYYLSKVKGLRVLALTWEIPFISESARASIEGAKRAFDRVEFITRSVCRADLKRVYRRLYELAGNTCACPSLAYLLFYPSWWKTASRILWQATSRCRCSVCTITISPRRSPILLQTTAF